jgi:hypothetical protein
VQNHAALPGGVILYMRQNTSGVVLSAGNSSERVVVGNNVRVLEKPCDLTATEWGLIFSVVGGEGPLYEAIMKLKNAKNEPLVSADLFKEQRLVNQYGAEYLNNRLRAAKIPFRLHRVECNWEKLRSVRKLAFIPWDGPRHA